MFLNFMFFCFGRLSVIGTWTWVLICINDIVRAMKIWMPSDQSLKMGCYTFISHPFVRVPRAPGPAGSRHMKAFRLRVLSLNMYPYVVSSWWFTQGSWVMVDIYKSKSSNSVFRSVCRCFQMFWSSGFLHICSISKMLQTAACFGCWWLWPCRRDKGMDRHVTRNVPLHFLKECHVQIYGWNMLLKDESWRQMIWQPFFFSALGFIGAIDVYN